MWHEAKENDQGWCGVSGDSQMRRRDMGDKCREGKAEGPVEGQPRLQTQGRM